MVSTMGVSLSSREAHVILALKSCLWISRTPTENWVDVCFFVGTFKAIHWRHAYADEKRERVMLCPRTSDLLAPPEHKFQHPGCLLFSFW